MPQNCILRWPLIASLAHRCYRSPVACKSCASSTYRSISLFISSKYMMNDWNYSYWNVYFSVRMAYRATDHRMNATTHLTLKTWDMKPKILGFLTERLSRRVSLPQSECAVDRQTKWVSSPGRVSIRSDCYGPLVSSNRPAVRSDTHFWINTSCEDCGRRFREFQTEVESHEYRRLVPVVIPKIRIVEAECCLLLCA